MLTTLIVTSSAAYLVLRVMSFGPVGPRVFLSLAVGLIAAGAFSFLMLLR